MGLYGHESWGRDQEGLKPFASPPPPGAASREEGLVTIPSFMPGSASLAESRQELVWGAPSKGKEAGAWGQPSLL